LKSLRSVVTIPTSAARFDQLATAYIAPTGPTTSGTMSENVEAFADQRRLELRDREFLRAGLRDRANERGGDPPEVLTGERPDLPGGAVGEHHLAVVVALADDCLLLADGLDFPVWKV
jgi:hypothetical protein